MAIDSLRWMPPEAPCLGVVLCPGRDADPRALQWLAEPLAAAGAAVTTAVYRDGPRYREDDPLAAEAGRAALREELAESVPYVVAGHSRGGTVALLAAATQPDWKAVAALAATSDQARLVGGLAAFAPTRYQLMVESRGASPEQDPGLYRRTSPLTHVAGLTAPVLLVHGTLDLVVPHDHTLWMQQALESARHPDVEVDVLPGVGHFFERTYEGYVRDQVAARVVAWLRARGLLPAVASTPGQPD
ncbi:prolyl oligopeptidase family serine peptidase [Nocardia sp. R6R-6]|uniref:prolyl oligopeptidase family serine peptidase n=1 Tax=Nocardia sp. R6R-6 TaxID=3459303 RepID=UPI00403DD896